MSDLAVSSSGGLWLRDAVGHDVGPVLTRDEAHEVTAKIKAYAGVACILLLEAHNRQAHKAMGYKTWAEYVAAEFDMSKSRSYQLISQARFVIELQEETSTIVDVSEWEARDLAPVKDEAIEAAVAAKNSLPSGSTPDEMEAAVRRSLDETRAALVAKTRPKEPDDPKTAEGDADEGPSGDAQEPSAEQEPPATPSVPPDPALKLMADLSTRRAEVAKWLAFDRHEQVIDSMTAEQRADYRSFVHSVWTHANATLDLLDAPARLKAVQ